jgi:hypothetical protein
LYAAPGWLRECGLDSFEGDGGDARSLLVGAVDARGQREGEAENVVDVEVGPHLTGRPGASVQWLPGVVESLATGEECLGFAAEPFDQRALGSEVLDEAS